MITFILSFTTETLKINTQSIVKFSKTDYLFRSRSIENRVDVNDFKPFNIRQNMYKNARKKYLWLSLHTS